MSRKRPRTPPPPSNEFDAVEAVAQTARTHSKLLTETPAEFIDEDGVLDYSNVPLKPDHEKRPFWVLPNGVVLLEASSPFYEQARDFLIAIAEPISRPDMLHEYRVNKDALFAAVSMGLTPDTIIDFLNRLSKVPVHRRLEQCIRRVTSTFGKVKLVLKNHRYLIESAFPQFLRNLNQIGAVQRARVHTDVEMSTIHAEEDTSLGLSELRTLDGPGTGAGAGAGAGATEQRQAPRLPPGFVSGEVGSDEEDMERSTADRQKTLEEVTAAKAGAMVHVQSFEIDPSMVEEVKKECLLADPPVPLLSEYDFNNDFDNPSLAISLKDVAIRSYQEKSLSKVFGNQRARSGIIVLPCGAGKTLVGITAICTIRKSALILAPNILSVEQWEAQLLKFTTVSKKSICTLTSKRKDRLPSEAEACILISTYSMMGYTGRRSVEAAAIMKQVYAREWGALVMDEVHMMPAESFRRVITTTKAHCRLGLTATLVREDNLIDNLMYLIGPKMYEANWMDLTKQGYLANAQCIEVWCPMTRHFYRTYLQNAGRKQQLLYVMNPNKLLALEYLLKEHRQHKVIVFSDNIFGLWKYAEMFKCLAISGKTTHSDRLRNLEAFRSDNAATNVLFLSTVGDLALDVPDCNVIIQISSHFASRRQEAQRLGRILRKKPGQDNSSYNAWFYSLVSTHTSEMYYSNKRRQYLVDQGYAYKVINNFNFEYLREHSRFLNTVEAQLDLLEQVMNANADRDQDEEERMVAALVDDTIAEETAAAQRRRGNIAALSGAKGISYMEANRSGM